mmetsp:Transcript_46364/g.92572  ORF Transcript_46364/g.92572 Transcript_46364/m.92572 type:complete len:207 (-) Transcript_46364:284-904(-)
MPSSFASAPSKSASDSLVCTACCLTKRNVPLVASSCDLVCCSCVCLSCSLDALVAPAVCAFRSRERKLAASLLASLSNLSVRARRPSSAVPTSPNALLSEAIGLHSALLAAGWLSGRSRGFLPPSRTCAALITSRQACFFLPVPPNLHISRQLAHVPQSMRRLFLASTSLTWRAKRSEPSPVSHGADLPSASSHSPCRLDSSLDSR